LPGRFAQQNFASRVAFRQPAVHASSPLSVSAELRLCSARSVSFALLAQAYLLNVTHSKKLRLRPANYTTDHAFFLYFSCRYITFLIWLHVLHKMLNSRKSI